MPSADAPAASGTQSIQRAALLLRLLTQHNRTGLRLVELYQKANLERPTTHRILQGLIAERMVTQHEDSKRYFLGPLVYEMGLAAAPRSQLRDVCHRHLGRLAQVSGDTVFLTARSGLDGVCLDRAEGAFPVKVFVLDVGRRRPLGVGGGGLAVLSAMDASECERILQTNIPRALDRFPRFDVDHVRRTVALGRERGHVLYDVLEVPGIRTLGVPICDADGQPVAAFSISTLVQRMDAARVDELLPVMQQVVADVQEDIADQPIDCG